MVYGEWKNGKLLYIIHFTLYIISYLCNVILTIIITLKNRINMKRKQIILLAAVALLCGAFVSCDFINSMIDKVKGTDTEAVQEETEQVADEVEDEVVEDEVVVAEEEGVLHTEDLALFGLQGPVKQVTTSADEYFKVQFDKQGRLIYISYKWGGHQMAISYESSENGKVTGRDGHGVKRDGKGRIVSITSGNSGCGEPGVYIEYGNGYAKQFEYIRGDCVDKVFVEVVEVDREKRATTEWTEIYGPSYSRETSTTYTYKKVDEWGNWTERRFESTTTYEETEYNDDTGEEETVYSEDSEDEGVEKRKIVYYE